MNETTFRISPHAAFWLIFLAVCLGILFLFSRILLPFAVGFVIAYLFHPVVDRAARAGVPRTLMSLAIVVLATLALIAALSLLVPLLLNQLGEVLQNLPPFIEKAQAYVETHYGHYLEPLRAKAGLSGSAAGQEQGGLSQKIAENVAPWVLGQLQAILSSGLAFFNTVALLFISPAVSFFMLRDWDEMTSALGRLLPRQDSGAIVTVAREIDWTISAYLRGTLTVLVILSAFYMVALGAIGLNYGLLIGFFAGLFSFVPYFGSIGGFLVAGGVAAAQFWPNYTPIAVVLVVFVLGQVVEGNILTPNIVGHKIRLHPVWLLFSLIASGYLLGFTGLLIAVPLAAVVGVLVRHLLRGYYASDLYQTEGPPNEERPLVSS